MWKTFLAELKHIFRGNKWRPWEWLVILFIPFLYGFFYMNAYWNPFGHTENLKIAVVDLDQSPDSKSFIDKIVVKGKEGLKIGSGNYKFNILDASSIYQPPAPTGDAVADAKNKLEAANRGEEEAKKLVDDGKFSAVIILDSFFGFNRNEIKKNIIDLVDTSINNLDKPFKIDELMKGLQDAVTGNLAGDSSSQQGNQLVTFYNSYKNNYLAGEMTNFGAGLSNLEVDAILPSIEEILDNYLSKKLPGLQSLIPTSKMMEAVNALHNAEHKLAGLNLKPIGTENIKDLFTEIKLIGDFINSDDAAFMAYVNNFDVATKNILLNIRDITRDQTAKTVVDNLIANPRMVESILNFVKLATSQGIDVIDDSKSLGSNVNTYGFGLAPYFTCIALWAGSLVMLFLIKNERHIKGVGTFKHYFGKSLVWIFTGWIQAIILTTAITLQGVNIGMDQWMLYLLAIFISTIFTLTVQGIGYAFRYGDMADFAAVILLVLQLVSSSGTFPVDMQWGLFKVIHPIIPFTYAINALREIMYAPDWKVIMENVGILLIFPAVAMTVALGVNFWFDRRTRVKHQDGTIDYLSYEVHMDDH